MSFDLDAPHRPPAVATLISALDRLEDIIDVENAAFEERGGLDLVEINRRKSRALLELSRVARGLPDRLDAATAGRLARLKAKLDRNLYVIALRIAAAREVGAILDRALAEAESDGTYSAQSAQAARAGAGA
jgi:hypothetical protein